MTSVFRQYKHSFVWFIRVLLWIKSRPTLQLAFTIDYTLGDSRAAGGYKIVPDKRISSFNYIEIRRVWFPLAVLPEIEIFFRRDADVPPPDRKIFSCRKAESPISSLRDRPAQYGRRRDIRCRSRYIGRVARAIDKDAVARCSRVLPQHPRAATRSVPSVASSFLDPCGRTPNTCNRRRANARLGATDTPASAYDER